MGGFGFFAPEQRPAGARTCRWYSLAAVARAMFTGPRAWPELVLINNAPGVLAGAAYKSEVLDSLVAPENINSCLPPSALSKLAIVRLRGASAGVRDRVSAVF
jgi:hypothetical protein